MFGPAGLEEGPGDIQLRLGRHLLLTQRTDPVKLTPGDVQRDETLFHVPFGHLQFRLRLFDLLDMFLIVQPGYQLIPLDGISHINHELS